MKIAKILMAAFVLASASASIAEPKCAHKDNGSLFASTNPKQRAKQSAPATSSSSSANGAIN
ncbi:MAG TPA: hypothetical protein VF412_11085 [Bdellovibrio sp.]|uniref:hypothetical protein n=1 Tax=Bdellovibrio sp. TaxID=28201 RepID=UPI002EFBE635